MRPARGTWCRGLRGLLLVPAVSVAAAGAAPGPAPAAGAHTGPLAALQTWIDRAGNAAADSVTLDSLQAHFAAPAVFGSDAWRRAATILQQHPHPGRAVVAPRDEPGERLILSGVVRDASGRPVAGAVVHVFQTNAAGAYTPDRPMDEPHARLSAWIVTGADGRYTIDTVRPGGYPNAVHLDGQDRKLPAHVHFVVRGGPGHAAFQLVFADDPRLDAHWRQWARDGGHPVAELQHGAGGTWAGSQDVLLQP